MIKLQRLAPLARHGLLSLALVAPVAFAGHLNALLSAELDGRQEVSAKGNNAIAGDPNGRGEAYVFGIDANKDTLCYNLQAKRIAELDMAPGNGRAAHIHSGKRGENGPVVANLAWPQGGQAGDCLTEGEAGPKFPTGEFGIVQRILKNPAGFYVHIHNAEYPNGAIRGQLMDTASH